MKLRIITLIMCTLLMLSLCACGREAGDSDDTTVAETPVYEGNNTTEDGTTADNNVSELDGVWTNALYTEDKTFGEGTKAIKVEVKADDVSVTFTINTDSETLGDALFEHSLIEGEKGPYGLYIKKVNGIEADYDKDQTYWLLTKNGEYMMTGVDSTNISDGEHYELTRTK